VLVFELVEDVEVVTEGMEGALATVIEGGAAHWTSCDGVGSVALSRRTARSVGHGGHQFLGKVGSFFGFLFLSGMELFELYGNMLDLCGLF